MDLGRKLFHIHVILVKLLVSNSLQSKNSSDEQCIGGATSTVEGRGRVTELYLFTSQCEFPKKVIII